MILALSEAFAATTSTIGTTITINLIVLKIITSALRDRAASTNTKLTELQYEIEQLTQRIARMEGRINGRP